MTRNMREGFCRVRSWFSKRIPLIGTLIALIGTVFMTSVSFPPLYCIPKLLSRIDNREAAWATLTSFDDLADVDDFENMWVAKNEIAEGETGFTELLCMLVSRNKMVVSSKVTEIQISPIGYRGTGESLIGTYDVELRYRGQSESFIVAEMSDVDGWIRDERLKWGIEFGFPILMFGLLISLVAQFIALRTKDDDPLSRR